MAARHVWLTVEQAAKRVQIGPKIIYRAIANGKLKAAKVLGAGRGGRVYRLRPEWVDAWLDEAAEKPPAKDEQIP